MLSIQLITRRLAAAAACLLIAGCASLDPTGDIADASALVEARTGAPTGWDSAWDDPADLWDGASPLSSDTAVKVALRNNRLIRAAVEDIVASRAEFAQAHLLPNPVINVALGGPVDGLGGQLIGAMLIQDLAWLWQRPAAIDAADANLRRAVLAVSDEALGLVAATRTAHAEVVYAERARPLAEADARLAERSAALVRKRREVGEVTLGDINRAEQELADARTGLAERRAELIVARRTLLEIMGRAADGAEWSTDGVLPDAAGTAGLDEASVAALATAQRLDVAAAAAAVEAASAGVELAERGRLPGLGAGVAYEESLDGRQGVNAVIEVSPGIFDGNGTRVAMAESQRRRARIEADGIRQAAVAEACRALALVQAGVEGLGRYQDVVLPSARRDAELAAAALDAGTTSLDAVLEAQRRLNQVDLETAGLSLAAARRLVELERAVGGSLAP